MSPRTDEPSSDSGPPGRAPLPQWWWDRSLGVRRIIASALVLAVAGALISLTWPGSGASDGGDAPSSLPDREAASQLVDALQPDRIAVWDAIAECESEGDWGRATGNGYYGGLQFSQATWLEFGGKGSPHEATREQQILIAERVQAVQGWGAWPVCAGQLGLLG